MIRNKKVTLCLLIGAILLSTTVLAFPVGASSPIIHVHSGDIIQEAIDIASEGTTIVVHQGVYTEVVNMWKRIALKGIGATVDGTVLMGAAGSSISGFTVVADDGEPNGIAVGGECHGGLVTGNTIYVSYEHGMGVGLGGGASNVEISNNVVHALYPVYAPAETFGVVIKNNIFFADANPLNPLSCGILMFYPKNPIITGNTIYGASWKGIDLIRCERAVVAENKINSDWMGLSLLGTSSMVSDNKVTGKFWVGIYIDSVWNTENDFYSRYNAVLSNTVIGENTPSSLYGVLLVEYTHHNIVAKNRISGVTTAILDKGISNIVFQAG